MRVLHFLDFYVYVFKQEKCHNPHLLCHNPFMPCNTQQELTMKNADYSEALGA